MLFDLGSKKLVVSRDVIFDEKSCWEWSKNSVKDISHVSDVVVQEEGDIHEQQQQEVIPPTPVSSSIAQPDSPNHSSPESPPLRTRSL